MTIGFVSCNLVGAITEDDEMIATALTKVGFAVRSVLWDGDEPDECVEALVLRSPWNYHLAPDAFLRWVERQNTSSVVYNDPQTIRWNAHKSYLFDLERSGVPIAPTVLCPMHEASDLRAIMRERNWNRAVVKPAISASSFMTSIVGPPEQSTMHQALHGRVVADGQPMLDRILETRAALVQPFMPEILERGERCLIFIDGAFSHAVRKTPFTDVCGKGEAVTAEPEEIALGLRALSVVPRAPLYARVDLLRRNDGIDLVMELELIDPELYIRFDPESANRFASAMLRRLNRPDSSGRSL
ncbi:MAG TPA: hypothetical protein VIK27_04680 [Candidatus Aquilonibacter sp.]